MPTFNGSITTRTRVAIDGDAFTPGMGTQSPGSGETEEALIHGNQKGMVVGTGHHTYTSDYTLIVLGNYTRNVTCNSTTIVLANLTINVTGNNTQTTGGNTLKQIMGNESHITLGGAMRLITACYAQLKASAANLLDPTSWFELKGNSGTLYVGANVSIGIVNLAIFGQNTEVYANQMNVLVSNIAITGLNFSPIMMDTSVKLNANFLEAFKGYLSGLEGQLGAMKPSFFATNLKALVVGINQYI